jgi:hypothetical protein
MSSWWQRWERRQNELAQGVDADLVRDNRRRYRLALGLLGFGFLLNLLMAKMYSGMLYDVVFAASLLCYIGGFIALRWAAAERAFLSRPDREDPPRILRK